MERKIGPCPLGCKCETPGKDKATGDDIIFVCPWYQPLLMTNIETKQDVEEFRCAIAWAPFLMKEAARTNRGQTAALESFRNETMKGQEIFNQQLAKAIENQQ